MIKSKLFKGIVYISLLINTNINADTIYCRVVGVIDGDTVHCLTKSKEQIKVRLYQIDAPEKKQAFGERSKKALSDLIFNKTVKIETHKNDKYNRVLGTIYFNKKDINEEMISLGMAWYYPIAKINRLYKVQEELARCRGVGLWKDKTPVAPWNFRKNNHIK